MKHNDIIAKFKKRLPESVFFQYWAKSMYAQHPFDCTLIAGGVSFCIEFKLKYDQLKKHQYSSLQKAAVNGALSYVIRGGLKRGRIRLETIDKEIILDDKYQVIIDYLLKEKSCNQN